MCISQHIGEQDESRDAVNLLYSNSFAGIVVTLLAGSVLAFGFTTPELSKLKMQWWVVMMICLTARLTDYWYWRVRLKDTPFSGKWPMRRFVIGALATAILWSSYILLISQKVELIELTFSLIIVAAMAGGSATVLAGSRFAATGYSSILLFPGALVLLLSEQHFQNLLGVLAFFFGIVMVMSAKKAANFTKSTIELKNYNSILISEMKNEKQEVNRINQELNRAYVELHKVNSSLEEEVLQRTERIHQLSNLDPLTGLYNRTAFTHALNSLLDATKLDGTELAVLFVDLNGFKNINDALGHKVGDEVLKIITGRILTAKSNGKVGRWGGDEFLLAFPGLSVNDAKQRAQELIKLIERPITIDSNITLNIGASIGISASPKHGNKVRELIQFADIAMYENKNSLQNKPVVFSEKLLQSAQQTERLREGLSQALERNELSLVYQPIISAKTKQVAGCEALLRWRFEGESISPATFIPIAEQSNLIVSIGNWVLRTACSDACKWLDISDGTLSVNVSMVQLLDEGFTRTLDEILEQTQLPPERLLLEITESIFAESKVKVASLLKEIMTRNVRVSIDDFGTGYSSMSQLQTLPFHVVKIDRSFVANINEKGGAIIRATLYIAGELGCKTVAEGIETKEQEEALVTMGASYLQGFLYSKPIQIEDLIPFIQSFDLTETN